MTLHAHVPTVLQSCSSAVHKQSFMLQAVMQSCCPVPQWLNNARFCLAVAPLLLVAGALAYCRTGQSTWVCSGQRLFRLKFANSGLRNMALTFLELFWVQVHDSISLGRTPELLVLGLRVCVGLGSRDRSLGFRAWVVFRRFTEGYISPSLQKVQ